jgi:hypothetical protein
MKMTQDFSSNELLLIREALTLLVTKVQTEGDEFNEFDTLSNLERDFTRAYYLEVDNDLETVAWSSSNPTGERY